MAGLALLNISYAAIEPDSRLTAPRRRVLELLLQADGPMIANDIIGAYGAGGEAAKPPTVYRALDFLIENGLIHRIERMNAFVGCSHPGESHRGFFLICGECGNAEELESAGVADTIAASASRHGFAARDMTLEVTGTCAECRK